MSKTVARILHESSAQEINEGLNDDNKLAFTNPSMDEFYCLEAAALEIWGASGEGKDYEIICLTNTQVDGTFPLPKRRKIPV